MKTTVLNVRLSNELRQKLEEKAIECNISLSDMVRDIMQSNFEFEEIEQQNLIESFKKVRYDSFDFIILTAWIFEKRYNYYDYNSTNFLENLKEIVLKILKDDDYPMPLRNEFDKVYHDIFRYLNEEINPNRYFYFGAAENPNAFKYNVLIDFIYSKGFSVQTIY
jgi:hypothetical protein